MARLMPGPPLVAPWLATIAMRDLGLQRSPMAHHTVITQLNRKQLLFWLTASLAVRISGFARPHARVQDHQGFPIDADRIRRMHIHSLLGFITQGTQTRESFACGNPVLSCPGPSERLFGTPFLPAQPPGAVRESPAQ